MSELIEKVVDATTAAMDGEDCSSHGMARAAIAAVAEWIGEHHQIDKDGSVGLALTWQYTAKSAPPPPEVK